MMRMNRLLCIWLAVCSSTAAWGQNTLGIPFVFNYNKAVFQGGSRTWDINQDSRGILYFANNDGLITFDGGYWKVHPLPNGTIVRSLYIDENDRVYAGGQGEFGYFEASGSVLQYTSLMNAVPEKYRQFADVWDTARQGSSIFFRTNDRIFQLTDGQISVYPTRSTWLFLGEAAGQIFAQDQEKGLLTFTANRWTPVHGAELLKGMTLTDVFPVGGDSLVFATQTNQTYLLHNHRFQQLDTAPWEDLYTPSRSKISNTEYATATSLAGCLIRDLEGHIIQRIGVAEGLANNNVSAVFTDRNNNIWVGVDNAISVITYHSEIKYFRPNLENDVTGFSTRVYQNKLYLSSSNGVYVAALAPNTADHSFSQGSFSLVPGSDRGEAWHLEEVNGQLLLAHNSGVFNITAHGTTPIATGVGSWLFLPLSSNYPAADILVGTYHGLDLLQDSNGQVRKIGTLAGQPDSYRFLERDEDGSIWASHPYRGIYHLHLSLDSARYDAQLFTAEHGLPSTFNNYVFKIGHRIVFATDSGAYEFDPAAQRFVPSATFPELRGIPIKYLKDDSEGNVWFCSGKKVGVARLTPGETDRTLIFFPEIEGLNTSGFENIYPYDRNNIYIGSEKGIIHINFEKYTADTHPPVALLSSIKTTGKKDSLIYGGYAVSDIPKLPPSFDSYQFRYGSPVFGIQNHVTYSYWLEGYDTDWSEWSTETEKHYTNLSNGRYTFKLKARKNSGTESEIVAYTFVILPPWYKTVWALVGYFAIFLFGIYLLVRWQQRAWQRQQVAFDEKLTQMRYIHQLEIEKNEKEIVKLQNEKLENEVKLKTKELANTSLHLMENTDALIKLKVELTKLDLHAGEERDIRRITSLLKDVEKNSANWDQFAAHFDELIDGFLNRLKTAHPQLTRTDLKVCAYLRLNFSSKQIAQLQNISVRGVEIHRYRLKKKLQLPAEQTLGDYLAGI